MKKIIFLVAIFSFTKGIFTYGQTSMSNNITNDIPQEKIFVHHNSTFLLSGEYMYYKLYCLNTKTNYLSDFSKIAYVELVGSDRKVIFKHKIKLNSGIGQGDFFIPTSIKSDNYKLIAYTQWMRNGKRSVFFQSDISIINPFHANQNEILKVIDSTKIIKSILNREYTPKYSSYLKTETSNFIDLKINAKTFSTREKVSLKINSLKGNASYGNYSISVRKIDTIDIPKKITASSNILSSLNENYTLKNHKYLPEYRGQLLSGNVSFIDSKLPASNIKVGLSIPGKNYMFKVASTNKSGLFYFNLDNENEGSDATIQVLDNKKEKFKIECNNTQEPINYDYIVFNQFKITSEMKDYILKHSIYNQIENAYSDNKSDSIFNVEAVMPFYNSKAEVFLLNDYTRFPTIKETIVEVINSVYTRKRNGNYTFHVRIYKEEIESGLMPLVIVDGNLIQNLNELANYNPKNVNKISVVSELYVYGGQLFEGIISIETFDGNYTQNISGDYIKKIKLFKPQINKKYFNQVYDTSSKLNRIPDFRRQLLWKPDFNLSTEKPIITFYTSDNTGDYEICLEGFTKNGKPVSIREIIRVE